MVRSHNVGLGLVRPSPRQLNGRASGGTPTPAPSWSVQPSISGTPTVGQMLTGNSGTISDGTVSSRAWLRGGSAISGATGGTYLLVEADEGENISYRVTASGAGGSANATSSAIGPIAAASTGPTIVTPPSIAGTLTNGSTITWTPAVWSTGTATGQWHRDGVPISGQTGLTYTYVAATDDGTYLTVVETNGASTATSNALIDAQTSLGLYSTSFAGTDGTLINGFESWVLGGSESTNTYRITGNDMSMHQAGFGSEHGVAREVGTGNVFLEVTIFIDPTSDASRKDRRFGVRYINNSNYVTMRTHANGIALTKKIAGTDTALFSITNGAYAAIDGRRFGMRASGNYIRIFVDGVEIAESIAANGGLGFDITGTTGTKIMVQASNSGSVPAYPFKVFKDVAVTAIPTADVSINTVTVEQLTGSGDVVAHIAGSFIGSTTTLQVMVMSPTGEVLLDWEDTTGISGNTYSFTTSALPVEVQGPGRIFWVRDKDNHVAATDRVHNVGYYAAINPMILGLNETHYPYWGGGDQVRDYGQRCSWLRSDYNPIAYANLDPETLLPLSYPAGTSNFIARSTVRTRFGVYDVTYPPSMSFIELAAGGSNTTVTTAFSGGSGQITVSGVASVRLRFGGTIPAGGADITMKPAGDTSTKLYTDQMLDDYVEAGIGIARFMTAAGINVSAPGPLTATNRLVPNDGGGRACTIEYMVEFCNDANCHLWFNVHHQADDSWISYHAAYIAANLNPGLKCYVEYSNEIWNGIFPAGIYSYVHGIRAGYYTVAGDIGPQTVINVDSSGPDATNALNAVTGYPNTSYPPGTLIMGNLSGFGWQIWQALTTTPTGAAGVVPSSGSNTNWTVVTNFAGVVRAYRRWQGVRSAEAFDLFDAEFANPRDRVIRVIGIQATDANAAIMERIDFQNVYQKIDRIAAAPYWGDGVAGISLGNYTGGHLTGWGATEKALYATDVAAWKTALFAKANSTIDAVIASQVALKNTLETTLRNAPFNLGPNAVQYCSYECNHHIVLKNHPDSGLAQIAFQSLRKDSRLGDATTYYLEQIQERLGGEHVFFDSVSVDELSLSGWGIMFEQGDRTNPLFGAVAAFTATL